MIIVTGSAVVQPDRRDEALAVGIAHSVRSRGEPGCLDHNCHVDAENPDRIVFVEYWTDVAALQAHFAVPESGAFVRQMTALAVVPPKIQLFQAQEIPMG
ncbi:MAG: putative quinol monooxygenase [Novosphingobium sp.]